MYGALIFVLIIYYFSACPGQPPAVFVDPARFIRHSDPTRAVKEHVFIVSADDDERNIPRKFAGAIDRLISGLNARRRWVYEIWVLSRCIPMDKFCTEGVKIARNQLDLRIREFPTAGRTFPIHVFNLQNSDGTVPNFKRSAWSNRDIKSLVDAMGFFEETASVRYTPEYFGDDNERLYNRQITLIAITDRDNIWREGEQRQQDPAQEPHPPELGRKKGIDLANLDRIRLIQWPEPGSRHLNRTSLGETLRSRTYNGRPILLVLWAMWCKPCWEEAPWLASVQQYYKGKLAIVGLVIQSIGAKPTDDEISSVTKQAYHDYGEKELRSKASRPDNYYVVGDMVGADVWNLLGAPAGKQISSSTLPRLILLSASGERVGAWDIPPLRDLATLKEFLSVLDQTLSQ